MHDPLCLFPISGGFQFNVFLNGKFWLLYWLVLVSGDFGIFKVVLFKYNLGLHDDLQTSSVIRKGSFVQEYS